MSLGVVDLIILIFLVLGGIVGFKNGVIKEGTQFIGIMLVVIVSFLLKDRLMVFLYESLPFFDFFGFIKGISAINILFYQLVSFLFCKYFADFFLFFMRIFWNSCRFFRDYAILACFLGMFYKLLNMVDVAPTRFAICEQVRIALV